MKEEKLEELVEFIDQSMKKLEKLKKRVVEQMRYEEEIDEWKIN